MRLLIFHFIFCSLILVGCTTEKKEQAALLLQDSVMREAVFDVILNDSIYVKKLMEKMRPQGGHRLHSMGSMHGRMMNRMLHSGGMDSLLLEDTVSKRRMLKHMLSHAERDSMFCKHMSEAVMKHKHIRESLKHKLGPPEKKER